MDKILVFAYGSNLDTRQMRSRCPSARVVSRAVLADHALAFGGHSRRWRGGVASLIPEPGARVEGLVYRLDRAELADLDRHEGTPVAYQRITKLVTAESSQRRRVQVYRQSAVQFDPRLPHPDYFRVLLAAYERLGFDLAPLAAAVGVAP